MGCTNDKSLDVQERENNDKQDNLIQNKKEDNAIKEKEENERKEKELKEQQEKAQKEKEEKERKEKELKEQQEKAQKEKEEKEKTPENEDEKTGNKIESHNKTMPDDDGHYLDISLNTKKNKVFIPTNEDLERFRRDGLKRHNYYRKYHQAGPMELTKELNDYAQKYAEELASQPKDVMKHSSHEALEKIYGDYTGENLYWSWSSGELKISGSAAVDTWYDEIKDYDFEKGCSKNGGVVGHFTQLVWKGSTQLGIGIARTVRNSIFVVANYHFGGNFNNQELTNVLPVKLGKEDEEKIEKQKKEKEEQEKKEKEEANKRAEELKEKLAKDENSGNTQQSHNETIPGDNGHYLDISLNTKKNNVFIPTNEDLERFQRDGLKRHNYYRKYHQVGPMELTKELNDYAQKYAEVLAAKNTMQHSTHEAREKIYGDWTGENLYYFWSSDSNLVVNGSMAVDSWYDEIKDYDFNKGKSKGGVVGHFTQLVWKGSTQLGIGVAKSSSNSVFVVANYHPGGNFNNKELTNVFPAKA